MESIIDYYYDLKVDSISLKKDYYFLKVENDYYLLKELNEQSFDLETIIRILNSTDIKYHLLVLTKENKTYFTYENKNYILLKIRCDLSKKISPFEFAQYQERGLCLWGDVWSKRVDYYETQIEEVIKNSEIKYALEYYIGLTEIAISYFNKLKDYYKNEDLNYSLSHKHLSSPINPIDYYDPSNIIIDLNIRGLAEFFKDSFFNEILTESELLSLINSLKMNDAMANYFYLRLLYPTYFFNLYDDYIETKELDDNMFLYIKKSKEYESLLSKVYSRLIINNSIHIKLWFISQH